jgi:predicted 3-demethylubiquinone-9 3-methyltransferase (glyoxalase superfamily)
MQKITPFLWFNDNAEEAVAFYTSVFKDGNIEDTLLNGESGPGPEGSVLTSSFKLNGQEFTAINGGPMYKFTEAISFVVHCDKQEEVDYYWDKLSAGGKLQACGWLKDKFGLSWQIVPDILPKLLMDKDRAKAKRVMDAMMKMIKLDIKGLKDAAGE